MPNPPHVAVIVTFYSGLADLEAALRSLCAQTYVHWQGVVVDDASAEDGAQQLVQQLGDARLTYTRHAHNKGVAAARNSGLRATQAPWILPLDGDDQLPTDGLQTLMDAVQDRLDVDCAFGTFQTYGAGVERWTWPMKRPEDLLVAQWMPGPGTLMRRTLVERVGGWCEEHVFRAGNEDWDFWLGVIASGELRALRLTSVTYLYQRRPGSLSMGPLRTANWQTRIAIVRRHRALFDRHGATAAFLRAGAWASAKAFWGKGDRQTAGKLALEAARLALQPAARLRGLID